MELDNFEESQEDIDNPFPSVHEVAEFAIRLIQDIEETLDQFEDPMDQTINGTLNAGMMLYMCWYCIDMYSAMEDIDEFSIEQLEDYVKHMRLTNSSGTMH